MTRFKGFPEGKIRLTPVPSQAFSDLLPEIDHLGELKVFLYALWRLERMEGVFRYLSQKDFSEDERFLRGLASDPQMAASALEEALGRCVQRGTLLTATLKMEEGEVCYYFLNSPKGRAAIQAITRGEWRPSGNIEQPLEFSLEKANIYRLYEENIGPLTPLIADKLRDAEDNFPARWIEEAFQIAVENNVRRWSYIEAILSRWHGEGRDERKDRRDTEKDRRRYVEGEFSDYIEH
jgi:DNA replication protein